MLDRVTTTVTCCYKLLAGDIIRQVSSVTVLHGEVSLVAVLTPTDLICNIPKQRISELLHPNMSVSVATE